MKNLLKKSFALLLAVVLCLSLTACGGKKKTDAETVVGDDWRNSGEVVASGTITHENEDSVDVLITVDENSASFYRDEPEQILFDSVSFPITIPDAWESLDEISLEDLDGDGETDVYVSFNYDSGDIIEMVWIWDPEERYVFREDLSTLPTSDSDGDISEYVGLWEYVDEDVWIGIYEDATWECFDDQGNAFQFGTLSVDSTGITFYMDESDETMRFERTESGDLVDSENDGVLVPTDTMPSVPYFSRYGLEINAVMDMGTYLLEGGVCSYINDGENYSTGDCYWEVIKKYDETHDGIREIQFDALCYVPQSDQEIITYTESQLYDFYTGKWLTAASTKGNSDRGENYYLHTIDWNGQSVAIEYAFSTDWQENVGDWEYVLTKSYVVYLPEGYDGLVFAAESKPDNFEDEEKLEQLDSIMPEAEIMDIDVIDPYGCLFFNVCD